MNISITHRLFLSILTATCIAILCIFFIMQWSIDRGFIQYLKTLDQAVLERASERLIQSYTEHGNWNFLRDNPRFWIMQMMAERPDDRDASKRLHEPEHDRQGPPLPSQTGISHRPRIRFILLDAERKALLGNPADAEDANFRPLLHDGKTIGYVGLLSPKHFLSPPQLQFLKQQKASLILAAIGIVLVVAIFSLPLAHHLVMPIKAMAAATHALASGRYSSRVPVATSDELGQLARDFNAMAFTLEQNDKARRQWVADISHELRTPLSVLRGEIEALLEGIRKTTPETITSLHAEVLRLHRLVEDLYQLSLADLGTLSYRKEDLNLAYILKESIESHHADFTLKGITLTEDIAQGLETKVFADRQRLSQLFGNLLDNSLRYTDAGGKLDVRLSCNKGQAVIDFEDSAPGVPESELEKIFDRLYRVEESRSRASGGAGLGLAICKNIVEAHAGMISAHPSPFGGLMIKVTIPVSGVAHEREDSYC